MSIVPGQKACHLVTGRLGKFPMHGEILSFKPPEIKNRTVDSTGGRYVKTSMVVGLEEMKFTLELSGAVDLMMLGFKNGDKIEVYSGTRHENGVPVGDSHYMVVKYFEVNGGEVRQGEVAKTTITGSLSEYVYKQNGKEIVNINIDSMEVVNRGQDMTAGTKVGMAVGAFNV